MSDLTFDQLLARARSGCNESMGKLLEGYRRYLLAIANAEIDSELAAKAGGSDLVQQTFVEAARDFEGFRGSTEAEFTAWLARILKNNLIDLHRDFRATAARNVERERPTDASDALHQLPAPDPSPSSMLLESERSEELERALARLPDDYRSVIEWRHRDRMRFAEIAARLGRSPDAARMLWNRALERLQSVLRDSNHPPADPRPPMD